MHRLFAIAAALVLAGCVTPRADVSAWVRLAYENDTFAMDKPGPVRFGVGSTWTAPLTTSSGTCSVQYFGKDPKPGTKKYCEVQVTAPAVVQVDGGAPVINRAFIPGPAKAYTDARVRNLSASELQNPTFQPTPTTIGAFRESCNYSHMLFDDPIVYPGVIGASHLHNFQGNDRTHAYSTGDSMLTFGFSSCTGGTLNRTAYWMPALIDIRTGQPLVPDSVNFYYKLGYGGVKAGTVKPFPKGLRMIAGDMHGTGPIDRAHVGLECVSGGGHQPSIPSCKVGDELNLSIIFPQCWDGVNLDSPDHKSHMAYAVAPGGCPSTHPVPFPEIALNTHYKVTEAGSGTFWKTAADHYSGPGGYAMHADWFNGWEPNTQAAWLNNCINASMDCHNHLLGDGRILY